MEYAYIVKEWGVGPPKIYQLKITKRTKNTVKCERTVGSGFNAQFTHHDFEKFFRPTPEEAIAKWRDDIAEHIVDLNREVDQYRALLRTTPLLNTES